MMQAVTLPCGQCGQPVVIRVAQHPKLVNLESVSIIVVEHQTQLLCSCGAVLQIAIPGLPDLPLTLVVVPPDKQASVIVPVGRLT